jgi:hypothetical protein
LFAQTDAPTPLPQMPTPRSTFLSATALASWHDKIRVVIFLFRTAIAVINYFVIGCAQFPGQIFLQLVTAVVGGDANAL